MRCDLTSEEWSIKLTDYMIPSRSRIACCCTIFHVAVLVQKEMLLALNQPLALTSHYWPIAIISQQRSRSTRQFCDVRGWLLTPAGLVVTGVGKHRRQWSYITAIQLTPTAPERTHSNQFCQSAGGSGNSQQSDTQLPPVAELLGVAEDKWITAKITAYNMNKITTAPIHAKWIFEFTIIKWELATS